MSYSGSVGGAAFAKRGGADLWQGHGALMRQRTTLYQMSLPATSLLVSVRLHIDALARTFAIREDKNVVIPSFSTDIYLCPLLHYPHPPYHPPPFRVEQCG